MLDTVRTGESRVLFVRGEAGAGKSALIDYLVRSAPDMRTLRALGVESEIEVPFAALHQLCAPVLDHLDEIPAPQSAALRTVFGIDRGAPPDHFLVGLATLSLLSEVSQERPLLCVVDDAQWLDKASARLLAFVGRRLRVESIGLVFGTRTSDDGGGLPSLEVGGLSANHARALLDSVVGPVLDAQVRDRILAEARGNPLALLELPHGLTPAELAGGFGLLRKSSLPGRVEESFVRRLDALPEQRRTLMLVAAAEPVGDPVLVRAAAGRLGLDVSETLIGEIDGLLTITDRVTFRHPLVRSAVYGSASPQQRRAVHLALAAVTDPETDPDRRAWHRATATSGPDEEVAAELERSASRAQARGGLSAAAAFLRRAVSLTEEPGRRADRALAASLAFLQAGSVEAAMEMLRVAERGSLSDFQLARMDLLRGRIASASNAGGQAPALLLAAAQRLEGLDVSMARATYLDAWGAALFAGQLSSAGDLLEVSQAAKSAPPPTHDLHPSDLLLDGLAELITDGRETAVPALRRAVSAFRGDEISAERGLQWGVLASTAAVTLWDFEAWHAVISRQVALARGVGALALLSVALHGEGLVITWTGNFGSASSVIAEAETVTDAAGIRIASYGGMLLAALRGSEDQAPALIAAVAADSLAGGEGMGVQFASWATAVLSNGLGRYDEALTAAREASEDTPDLFISHWALSEVIEASTRTGDVQVAFDAVDRLESVAVPETDWSLGVVARSRALISTGEEAERLYLEATERLARTPLRPELARAHLLYGEWLRRERRRADARVQLRIAHDAFAEMGMDAFAERARRELLATGETARKRTVETHTDLTSQELQIAELARDGLTNPEIGARLFISSRTVEWHMRKIFAKLGISSRRSLRDALPGREPTGT